MRKKTIYIADDGKEFETMFDCEKYERELEKKEKLEEQEACENFFLTIGIDLKAYKSVQERNQVLGISFLIFDKNGEVKGIKTVGSGQKKRYGITCDFLWVSSSTDDGLDLMNWLEKKKLYAHNLSSFLHRNKGFYKRTFLEKLENLGWEIIDGCISRDDLW